MPLVSCQIPLYLTAQRYHLGRFYFNNKYLEYYDKIYTMTTKRVYCPFCQERTEIQLNRAQKVRRCGNCSRTIRVLPPPRGRRQKSKK